MHLSRIQIANFRNFRHVDVPLGGDVVMVGENRVGKTNFIFAIRLVLDAALPDSARQLKLGDFWDGCDPALDNEIGVHLDFSGFDGDPNLVALLTDYRVAEDHTVARLSYVYRKKADVSGPAGSEADYEFKVYGGGDEARSVRNEVRRRISLDLLPALRDAEADLGTWRSSPLRPLLEDAISKVAKADLDAVAGDLSAATSKLGALEPIRALEEDLRAQIGELAGSSQDIRAKLGFSPSDPLRVFRSIGLFIDDGKRGIADASLGSANLALLALKLAEFKWRRLKNERNYSIVCIEEPEAHLHPHLQRSIFQKLFTDDSDALRGLFLTTHSPVITSVSPLKSIVVLRGTDSGAQAYSLAKLGLSEPEIEDLQRYIDATRAEILFSRAVVFVEGDAEAALLPGFAATAGYDLDELGITICNVGGVHFRPYVKLAAALGLPFVVITDWDPLDGSNPPLGKSRAIAIHDAVREAQGKEPISASTRALVEGLDDDKFRAVLAARGIFLNSSTLELEIAGSTDLLEPLLAVLRASAFGSIRRKRLELWSADPALVDPSQLLAMVADVGKGRLAGRLAATALGLPPPSYIAQALKYVVPNG
jgi:putative ATP-dependent endonuclease of OLD family